MTFSVAYCMTIRPVAVELVNAAFATLGFEESTAKNSSIFTYLRRYINNNITEKLTVEKLCSEVGMSKSALSRNFKIEYGISPMEFV